MNARDDSDDREDHRRLHDKPSARRYEPLRPLDPDAELSPAETALVERERDVLVQLVARRAALARDLSSPLVARFLDWYARELRESLTPPERVALAEGARAFAARFAQRQDLASTGVACVEGAPVRSGAPDAESLSSLVTLGATARQAPRVDLAVAAGAGRELWEEPCSEWVALPDEVPSGRYLALMARGRSMEPLLHSGDVILVRLGHDLERGTVVVVRHPDDGYVVKRVGAVAGFHVELTSLNPDYPPVRVPRDAALVLGTVILRWCGHSGVKQT